MEMVGEIMWINPVKEWHKLWQTSGNKKISLTKAGH